jgi:hypothetical protein
MDDKSHVEAGGVTLSGIAGAQGPPPPRPAPGGVPSRHAWRPHMQQHRPFSSASACSRASCHQGPPRPPAPEPRPLGNKPLPSTLAERRSAAVAAAACSRTGSDAPSVPKGASCSSSDDTALQSGPTGRDQQPPLAQPPSGSNGNQGSSHRLLRRLWAVGPPAAPRRGATHAAMRIPLHECRSSSGSAPDSRASIGGGSRRSSSSKSRVNAALQSPPPHVGPLLANLARLPSRHPHGRPVLSQDPSGRGPTLISSGQGPPVAFQGSAWASSSGSASVGSTSSGRLEVARASLVAAELRWAGVSAGDEEAGDVGSQTGEMEASACGSNILVQEQHVPGPNADGGAPVPGSVPLDPSLEGLLAAADEALERTAAQLAVEAHRYATHGALLGAPLLEHAGPSSVAAFPLPADAAPTCANLGEERMPWDLLTPEGVKPVGSQLNVPAHPITALPAAAPAQRPPPPPMPAAPTDEASRLSVARPPRPRMAAGGFAAARKLALAGLRLPWLQRGSGVSDKSSAASLLLPLGATGPLTTAARAFAAATGHPIGFSAAPGPQPTAAGSLRSSCKSWSPLAATTASRARASHGGAGAVSPAWPDAGHPRLEGTNDDLPRLALPQPWVPPAVVVTTGWPGAATLPRHMGPGPVVPAAAAAGGIPGSGSVRGPERLLPGAVSSWQQAPVPFGAYSVEADSEVQAGAYCLVSMKAKGWTAPVEGPVAPADNDGLTPNMLAALYRLPMHLVR